MAAFADYCDDGARDFYRTRQMHCGGDERLPHQTHRPPKIGGDALEVDSVIYNLVVLTKGVLR